MNTQDKIWLWFSALVLMVMGTALVVNVSGIGWFLIILGIGYVGVSVGAVQKLADSILRLTH
jgi:TM2 domain-containing membrane protein YozV